MNTINPSEIINANQKTSSKLGISIAPKPTGRRLIYFKKGVKQADAQNLLEKASGKSIITPKNIGSISEAVAAYGEDQSVMMLNRFRIAVVGGDLQNAANITMAMSALDEVEDTRPEFWMHSLSSPPWGDIDSSTWGLKASKAIVSAYDGTGIKLAILDTGIDLKHPDFIGRSIKYESFDSSGTVNDVQGHGTHCAGVATSNQIGNGNIPRYGVASAAELFVGKVLGDNGSGREMDIIAGMEWAIDEGCEIISMSLGRPTAIGENFDPIYEDIAREALDAGTLIIAAAGNESDRRYGYVAPVGSPANAPSIMAVAAIGSDAGIASFSCGATGSGNIDICAPGVAIFSSVPTPKYYAKMQGTSMACPHVAGIAALWAQSNPALRGRALWNALTQNAIQVSGLPARDVGSGLVQAP